MDLWKQFYQASPRPFRVGNRARITIIARWDYTWSDPRDEAFLFRQLCTAFDVHKLMFVGPYQQDIPVEAQIEQYPHLDNALEIAQGVPCYLEPDGERTLQALPKDEDVVYIFGNRQVNNRRHSTPGQRYRFLMPHPEHRGMFAVTAAAIVLAVRYGQ